MKPYLFLIRGLPGSGKSTLARQMAPALLAVHYETDMWMVDDAGNYKFDPSKLSTAHRYCQEHTADVMRRRRQNVIVSNTFVRKWEMDPYADMAIKYDYQLVIVEARGNYGSVHNVPETTMERMRDNWENV